MSRVRILPGPRGPEAVTRDDYVRWDETTTFAGMRRLTVAGPRGSQWRADVPSTLRERTRGLRGRTLDPDQALLLEHCRSVHTIDMPFPITVVFLDASWRVTRVARTPTGRIVFCRHSRHVLECHIGTDVRPGDRLSRAAAPGEPATRDAPGTGRPARR